MKILSFETASGRCSVSISENADIIATELILEASSQAENLTLMIEKTLQKAKLELSEIDYIATSNGPGSFTGIRIGLAAALGLSLARNITPIIVSNFGIINYRIREQYRNFDYSVTLIDAFRDELYMQIFDIQNKPLGEPKLLNIDEVIKEITALNGIVVCAGSGAKKIQSLDSLAILPRFPYPDSRIICKLAHSQVLREEYSTLIEPLYIRLPDAKLPGGVL